MVNFVIFHSWVHNMGPGQVDLESYAEILCSDINVRDTVVGNMANNLASRTHPCRDARVLAALARGVPIAVR